MAKRKSLSKKVRFELFKRDDFTCQYCGGKAPSVVLNIDHIVPVSKGGDNKLINLVTSCFDCNQGKKARKLNDKSVIKAQENEFNLLKEKKEQMDMLLKHRKNTIQVGKTEAKKICDIIEDGYFITLSEYGKKQVKKLIKKFGFEIVLESVDIAIETYEDDEIGFQKIGGICKNRSIERELPGYFRLCYARGVLNNRLKGVDYGLTNMLKQILKTGINVEEIVEFSYTCDSWNDFYDFYNNHIDLEVD